MQKIIVLKAITKVNFPDQSLIKKQAWIEF